MSPPRRDPDEAFQEYLRRRAGHERANPEGTDKLPPEWRGRRRRRVESEPPDLEHEEKRVLAFAETTCKLDAPRVADVKRLEGGRCGYLLRGRCGGVLYLRVERDDRVSRVGTEREWRETPEVLR